MIVALERRWLRGQTAGVCNLYRMTSNVEAKRRLFSVVEAPNLPLFEEIYPKREAPIIRAGEHDARRLDVASWGIVGPAAAKGPVTNIRNLASPFWRTALSRAERRCLVPVTAFAE